VLERLAATGSDPVGNTPEEFAAHIRRELELFGKVIRTAGIKAN
jgi:tripartite-type tricarboxylate transporter receptor subunit TctC